MGRKLKPWNYDRLIVSALRKISRWDPSKKIVLKAAQKGPNLFQCQACANAFGREAISVDHINPVVKLHERTTWDAYIKRMFCGSAGFQILCKVCHDTKTRQENAWRRQMKKGEKRSA